MSFLLSQSLLLDLNNIPPRAPHPLLFWFSKPRADFVCFSEKTVFRVAVLESSVKESVLGQRPPLSALQVCAGSLADTLSWAQTHRAEGRYRGKRTPFSLHLCFHPTFHSLPPGSELFYMIFCPLALSPHSLTHTLLTWLIPHFSSSQFSFLWLSLHLS